MPTIPEASATQEILRVVSVGMLLVGGLAVSSGSGLLRGRRGLRKPSKPSATHLTLGIVLVLGGMIAMAFRREPGPEPEVISAERFSSPGMPAISIVAPAPWQLAHDAPKGRVLATRAGGKLLIETSFITDAKDRAGALEGVFGGLQAMGLVPEGEPFAQWFDGLEASARIGTSGAASSAVWVVERPGRLFTIIVCTSETGHDAQTACDPVLSSLRWRAPGPR